MPAHNAAAFLPRTIPAVLANARDGVEVIVVDDGSTDLTPALLETWAKEGKIRVIRAPSPLGPAAARNLGAKAAGNPFLLFVDADVEVPEFTVEYVRETLDLYRHRPEVVGVLGCYTDEVPHRNFPSRFKNLTTVYLYRATATISPFLHTSIFAVRRSVLDAVGGFDETLRQAEDFRLGLRLGSQGFRFVIDWRIRGIHHKRCSWTGILREDWRRIVAMSGIRLSAAERRFSLQAHRWNRLASLVLPGLSLAAAVSWPWLGPLSLAASGLGFLTFQLLNLGFLRFVRRKEGWRFSAAAACFLFLEMLWAGPAVVRGRLASRLGLQGSAG